MKVTKDEKEMLRGEFAKAWDDPRMVTYCTNKVSGFVTIRGTIITIDKPSIETRFCFGEHGFDFDEVNETCDRLSRDEGYFIAENIRRCAAGGIIKNLEDGHPFVPVLRREHYTGQTEDCRLGYVEWVYWYDIDRDDPDILTADEIAEYRQMCEEEIEKFTKRLRTYLKRYGLSKCDFWTYWADR